MSVRQEFDVAIVGAGIVGLACALAAVRRGLRVLVIERSARALGASVRNFGFVTVSGQEREVMWPRARRSREVWQDVAAAARVPIVQRGSWLAARRPESAALLEAFLRSDMGGECALLTPSQARQRCPGWQPTDLHAVLSSPHELRVESRTAIPALAEWLAREHGVEFRWHTAVHGIAPPRIDTSRGTLLATAVVVCPGDDFATLFPERIEAADLRRCALQMLRLESPGFLFPATVMADLSLVHYGGFADLPEAAALRARLAEEQPEHMHHGIHLIVAQGLDGSLVVGDSHHYEAGAPVFADARIDALILDEYRAVTGLAPPPVRERWLGTYAKSTVQPVLFDTPMPGVRLVIVTSGVGASTGFAIGEEVINALFD